MIRISPCPSVMNSNALPCAGSTVERLSVTVSTRSTPIPSRVCAASVPVPLSGTNSRAISTALPEPSGSQSITSPPNCATPSAVELARALSSLIPDPSALIATIRVNPIIRPPRSSTMKIEQISRVGVDQSHRVSRSGLPLELRIGASALLPSTGPTSTAAPAPSTGSITATRAPSGERLACSTASRAPKRTASALCACAGSAMNSGASSAAKAGPFIQHPIRFPIAAAYPLSPGLQRRIGCIPSLARAKSMKTGQFGRSLCPPSCS
ncbi:MAG: hypothetical protein WDN44_00030 [Sphingomonas sp.]